MLEAAGSVGEQQTEKLIELTKSTEYRTKDVNSIQQIKNREILRQIWKRTIEVDIKKWKNMKNTRKDSCGQVSMYQSYVPPLTKG